MSDVVLAPKLSRAGEGEVMGYPLEEMAVRLEAKDTGNALSLLTFTLQPGAGTPPHYHTREDEIFIIREGEVQFVVAGETIIARAGDVVFGPRNVPHNYLNASDAPAKFDFISTGASFEQFLRRMYPIMNETPPNLAALMELADEFGIKLLV